MFRRHVMGMTGFGAASLAAASLAVVSLAVTAPAVHAQQVRSLKLGIVGRRDTPEGVGLQAMIEKIRTDASGRLSVDLYPSGALGGEREMLEGLQSGGVDLAYVTTAALANFVPEMQIFDLPFLFRDFAHASAVFEGPIGAEYLAKMPGRNLRGLALGGLGFRQLSTSVRAVADLEDLKGLKIRTPVNQIHLEAWRTLGALPTPMALSETFLALKQGMLDGQEDPLSAMIGNRFNEVQKFVTLTRHAFTATVIVMAPASYAALLPAEQMLLRDAARLAQREAREEAEAREVANIARLRTQRVIVFETIDHAKFQAALAPAYRHFAQRFGEAAIARIRDTR